MSQYINREIYLEKLINRRDNGEASLKRIDDSFKKIVIVGDDIATYTDEDGFVFMGLFQFLRNEKLME